MSFLFLTLCFKKEDSVELRMSKVASGNFYYNYVINTPVKRRHQYYIHNTLVTCFMLLVMGTHLFL